MLLVKCLVNMTEQRCADLVGPSNYVQKLIGILQSDLIQPLATHHKGWMVQTNYDVFRGCFCEDGFESVQFLVTNAAAGIVIEATVDTGQ